MWEQIQANRRRSAMLMGGMTLVLMAMGFALGEAFGRGGGLFGLGLALIILSVQFGLYALSPASVVMAGMAARKLERHECPRLFNIVEEMQLASGLPAVPDIYMVETNTPNAFAYSSWRGDAAVAVTTGLLWRLNRDELQGVIAHEIAHIKNQDVKFITLAGIMVGTAVILSDLVMNGMRFGSRGISRSRSRSDVGSNIVTVLIMLSVAILAPILARLLYFAISRRREYLADASAAVFTRYPAGLASALQKIATSAGEFSPNRVADAMCIINPLEALAESDGLFSTHPPTNKRIAVLKSMAGAGFADYQSAFATAVGGASLPASALSGDSAHLTLRDGTGEEPILSRQSTSTLSDLKLGFAPIHCQCGMEMRVPPGYQRDSIRCVKCGTQHAVTSQETAVPSSSPTPDTSPGTYTRTRPGQWETFPCTCGATINLSPTYSGTRLDCPKCKRPYTIQ